MAPCPPCRTASGMIVPVGTIAYRPLDLPARGRREHGSAGPHYNLYRANQAPREILHNRANVSGKALVRCSVRGCHWVPLRSSLLSAELSHRSKAMKSPDGQEIRVGDRVKLGQDEGGVVVASIDTNEYSAEHPSGQW